MKAIILSAGQGRRLLPLTEATPKCALPVAGRTLLEWQLHEIAGTAVDEVVVITGFGADRVDEIAAATTSVPVRTLYNPFYALSDNLGTCWVARAEMDRPFVLINGDTLFEAAILERLLATGLDAPITLVTDRKDGYDADDMKVVVEHGRLRRVGKTLTDGVNGESIGMMAFRGTGPALFRDTVAHLMRYGEGVKRWYLSAIDEIAGRHRVDVCDIHGLSWCEVDEAEDLAHADHVVRAWPAPAHAASGNGHCSAGSRQAAS
ncbi:MAG TPA: phosphocholine cytidylyltransferase family protein [Pseudomonadales bacterium]